MSKTRISLTVLFAVLSILWMSVIFGFSANNADKSAEQSHGVVELIMKLFVPGFSDMDEVQQEELIAKYDRPVRKVAHFTSYALLGFLLYLCFGSPKWLPDKKTIPIVLAFPLCVIFAFSDEYHQTMVEGRAGRFSDVMIDSGGAIFGIVIAIAAVCIVTVHLKRRDNLVK